MIYRFSSNVPFLELDYPLNGAKCRFGILHWLYNPAPKKVILYEKQYIMPMDFGSGLKSPAMVFCFG
jgi:hypothetical protein